MQQRRGPWSPMEDGNLVSLVQRFGAHNWVRISQLVGTRSPKQCRERFHQNLKPQLNRDPITPEEGALIEQLVAEMGKRWAEIARRLKGRSDNAVKNWWNGGMNRRKRMCMRQKQIDAGRSSVEQERAYKLVSIEPMPHSPSFNENSSQQHLHHHPTLAHPQRNYVEPALLSPPLSISMSRRGSKETTPALTMDSTSPNSASPRLPASPSADVNLPPLAARASTGYSHAPDNQYSNPPYDDRRRSLPHPIDERRYSQSSHAEKLYTHSNQSPRNHLHEHGGYLAQLAELSQSFRITEPKQMNLPPPATPTTGSFPTLPVTPLSPAGSNKDQRMNLSSILL
ncbi:hypothetical protein H072_5668 [Dactylellina haptotyla CBS 200.50]|uniref:Uncharacterized protein n=1 Tax=Dactylellina haptotyla (strain CBS 200.50) TaxID=1284197 RepID=S8AC31_DACHA|nr:hypothetical protein H072_5668 [Dactylellina haptotyla CBS 200.50]